MNLPGTLKYAKSHEWIRIEGEEAYIGITDFAQGELGDIVFVEIETVDEPLKAGDSFGTIEAVKTVTDVYIPVDGTVLEVNPALEGSPDIVNKSPYDDGWLIKIKVDDASQAGSLMSAEEYKATIDG